MIYIVCLFVVLCGDVPTLAFSDTTCQLQLIQNCTNDLWLSIRSKTYDDVQEQLKDGCGFWEVYGNCLATNPCFSTNYQDYYLDPLDVQVTDEGTMTIGRDNETAKVKNVIFNMTIPLTDGEYLFALEEKNENEKENGEEEDENQNQLEEDEDPKTIEFPTPAVWKYIILETGTFFDKIALCDDLNNTALSNVSLIRNIVAFRNGLDLVEADDSKCYKSYECFTDLLTSVADTESNHPCDIFHTFISCQEKSNEDCKEKTSLHYVDTIKSIWVPVLDEFGKIPEFCDSFAKNKTRVQTDE